MRHLCLDDQNVNLYTREHIQHKRHPLSIFTKREKEFRSGPSVTEMYVVLSE